MVAMRTRLLRDVYLSHGSFGSIGLDRYPIFDEAHREPLNQKIVQHYAMREIGFDTDDMFIFELRAKMNEIMPVYNELYYTQTIKYDPLMTSDITTTTESASDSSTDTSSHSDNSTKNDNTGRGVQSEPPASELSGNGQYATGISDSQSHGEVSQAADNTATGHDSRKGSATARTAGRSTAAPVLVQAYRDAIVNVDMMVVSELEELFMQILSTDDNDIVRFPTFLNPLFPFGV